MSIKAKPWEGGGAASVPDASETVKGIIRIATSAEATTGTDDTIAMTPLTVKERIDASLVGGVEYKGTFDATAGTPSLANAEKGDMYVIDTAGTIYGQDWNIGDHLLINEDMGGLITNSKIDKIDNTVSDASETVKGIIRIATNTEAGAGSATDKALVPSNVSSLSITSSQVSGLATVATTGAYSDLSGTPTLATVATTGAYSDLSGTPTLATVATTGAYSDLSGTPTLGTAAALDVGTGASNVVQLDGSARLPAVDGSQLTNLPSGATDLNGLSDVTITSAASGNLLQNNGSGQFVNVAKNTIDVGTFNDDGTYLNDVVDDTSPQLGGPLDVNGQSITSASSGDVTIDPNGTGDIVVGADVLPAASATHTLGAEDNRFITLHSELNGAVQFKARNESGGALTKGQAVYISGVSGTVPLVSLARANSASTMPAFGLLAADVNNNADVQVVTFGNLTDYNTTTYSLSANDTVFVSASTAGALTNSAPTGESNLIQNIGRVVRADASAGIIKVGGAGRSNATPNLDNNKIFVGNGSNQAVSTALSAIDVSAFNDDGTYQPLDAGLTSISGLTTSADKMIYTTASDTYAVTDITSAGRALLDDADASAQRTTLGLGTVATLDVGTGASNVVQLDGSARLPAVDGSQLTNLPSGGGWTYSAITADPANAQAGYHYSCTGTFTITLPTSGVSAGEEIRVKNMGTGTITIDPQTQNIDGSTTDYTMDIQYSAITLVSTGTHWEII